MRIALPRSLHLVLWQRAVVLGRSGPDDASDRVVGADEPHALVGAEMLGLELESTLGRAFSTLCGPGTGLRLALPEPGALIPLVGPPASNTAALDAGEGVLVTDSGVAIALLVPGIELFGSELEPGWHVTWRGYPTTPRIVPSLDPPAIALRALRLAMAEATDALTAIDAAAGASREDLTIDHPPTWAVRSLAPGLDATAESLLLLATRLFHAAEAGLLDSDIASVFEANARRAALVGLRRAARSALLSAVDGAQIPVRPVDG